MGYSITEMTEILDLMLSKGVLGFEVGDFKVTFNHDARSKPIRMDDETDKRNSRDIVDDELGLDFTEEY
jgi:hypothetical protein